MENLPILFSDNQRAIRAYKKLGLTHEGAVRAMLYREGQRHDLLIMNILRPEWEQQQAAKRQPPST